MIEYFLNTMEPLRQRNKRRIDHTIVIRGDLVMKSGKHQ